MRGRATIAAASLLVGLAACRSAPPDDAETVPPALPEIAAVEPRFQPALEAIQRATHGGEDELARRMLTRLFQMQPTGAALELARGFERILDGRAATRAIDLRVECVGSAAHGGIEARVSLVARASDGVARELAPGPATLVLALTTVDASGRESHGQETRSLAASRPLVVDAGGVRADLARVPLELPPNALALRLVASLDLRGGTITVEERKLPAMRPPVATGEIVVLDQRLLARGPATSEELLEVARTSTAGPRDVLEVALRVVAGDRGPALDALAADPSLRTEPAVTRLVPALRWLAPDVEAGAGGDPGEWRAFLDRRAGRATPQDDLVVPRR